MQPENDNIPENLFRELEALRLENATAKHYIRRKVNQLLTVMGTSPLRSEELDDATLIELDPIGIVSDSFVQILRHLKATNAQLKEAHDEITAIFDSAGMGILVLDRDMRILTFNRKAEEQFGVNRDAACGTVCYRHMCKNDGPPADCPFTNSLKTGRSCRSDMVLAGRTYDVVAAPVGDAGSAPSRFVLVYMDTTERTRAQEKLRKSEERYRDLFENSTDLIQVLGADSSIRYVNRAWRETLGYTEEEVSRLSIFDVIHPECADCIPEFENVVAGRKGGRFETMFITRNREKIIVEGNVSAVYEDGVFAGTRGIFRDITEKKKIEERIIKAEKIESLGMLAGGIAHDFNNLLQGVFGYISLAKKAVDKKEKALAMLEQSEKALRQSINLTTQLLTFSRGGKPVKKPINLRPVIEDSVQFALSGSRSCVSVTIPADLRPVEADEGQMGRVIQNVVLNADQAMPAGGTVTVTAANRAKDDASLPPGLPAGDYVVIAVQDTGAGIPEEHVQKIFDPYFTTKEKGSGLGLATCYSIVANHGGLIDVRTKAGQGSTFLIYLPALSPDAATPSATAAAPSARRRSARILVMDDEEIIRKFCFELLGSMGHKVELAKNGEEALAKYQKAAIEGNLFDVVILDLTIRGGMGGSETMQRLIGIDPAVKAIVSSGYSEDGAAADYARQGFKAFLRKPYELDEMSAALDAVLGRDAADAPGE